MPDLFQSLNVTAPEPPACAMAEEPGMKHTCLIVLLFSSCAPHIEGYWKNNVEVMGIDRHEWRIESWTGDSALMHVPYRVARNHVIHVKYDWFPRWVPLARYEMRGEDTLTIQWMNEFFNEADLDNPEEFLLNPKFSEYEPSVYTRFSKSAVEAGVEEYRERRRGEGESER